MIKDLVYASPESVGIRSADILKFIRFIEENKINLHGFLFAKDGKIIAEGYFPPFDESFLHRLYSSTKTYVALAVGMLVTEGRITVKDKIVSFFPELDISLIPEFMRECTVEDALKMASPHHIGAKPAEKPALSEHPYSAHCQRPSGTIFNYGDGNALCTQVVERVSGMYLTDYLRPLFDKLGIGEATRCIADLGGIAWGGSGMLSTLRDFAKVAEFVMHKGCHGGEQIIDREFMESMTTPQISNVQFNSYTPLHNGGYGYQLWITPDAVCMRGMGAQEGWGFTKGDMLFVSVGDTMCDNDFADARMYDAVKYFVYENIGEPMPEGEDYRALCSKLKSLDLPRYGKAHSDTESEVSGVSYKLDENDMGWRDFKLDFCNDEGVISYRNARGEKRIRFGLGKYVCSTFPETHYYDNERGVPSGRELDCMAIAEWVEDKKLLLRVYITDVSFANIFAQISFKGDYAALLFRKRGEFLLDDYGGIALGHRLEP